MTIHSKDFIPYVLCWFCQRDLDALPWTAEFIGGGLHPVCDDCRKEKLS